MLALLFLFLTVCLFYEFTRSRGKLHLKIECDNECISVQIIEAKGLRTSNNTASGTFIEVTVVPDKCQLFTQRTPTVQTSTNPKYQHTVQLDLSKANHACRRIIVSLYAEHHTQNQGREFLGGMSFGIPGIQVKKQISGWYYILNESVSRKKHLKAPIDPQEATDQSVETPQNTTTPIPSQPTTQTPTRNEICVNHPVPICSPTPPCLTPNVLPINVNITQRNGATDTFLTSLKVYQTVISRGSKGFGFTLSGARPVSVSHVERGSPAYQSGVINGDCVLAVDRIDVSQASVDQVVQFFRSAKKPILLTMGRQPTFEVRLPPLSRPSHPTTTNSTHNSINNNNNKSFSTLLPKSCFSPTKKSAPTHSTSPPNLVDSATPLSPQSAHLLLNASQAASQLGAASNLWSPLFTHGLPPIRNSKTEFRLSDEAESITPPSVASFSSQQRRSFDKVPVHKPSVALSDVGQPCYRPQPHQQNCFPPSSPLTTNQLCLYPINMLHLQHSTQNPALTNGINTQFNHVQSIIESLKYVNHVNRVDFRIHPPQLEYHGCLNLLEANRLSKVDLLMFTDLLLIAQRAPNRYFTVIKDPIYNTKICYANIPPYAPDQLILQYIDCNNRKQIVHFQGPNVRDWLNRIQSRMIYNSNWWMNNMPCAPVNFQ